MATINMLLVTQDEDVKSSLAKLFDGGEYSLDTVSNEEDALSSLREKRYSVIFDDINYRGKKSYCLLHKVAVNQYSGVSIYMLADGIAAEDILLSYELGAIDIFEKKFEMSQLKILVDQQHHTTK